MKITEEELGYLKDYHGLSDEFIEDLRCNGITIIQEQILNMLNGFSIYNRKIKIEKIRKKLKNKNMNTDDLRQEYGSVVTKYNKCIGDNVWTDEYVLWLENQILTHRINNNEVKFKFNEFINKQQDLDSNFVKIVNDNFWDLI